MSEVFKCCLIELVYGVQFKSYLSILQTLEAIAVLIKLLNTLVYRLLERLYKDRFPHKKSSLSIIQVYYRCTFL